MQNNTSEPLCSGNTYVGEKQLLELSLYIRYCTDKQIILCIFFLVYNDSDVCVFYGGNSGGVGDNIIAGDESTCGGCKLV